MIRKLLAVAVCGAVGAALGLLVGANIGGNFATDFELAGQRGYEAAGVFGALCGFVVGAMVGSGIGSPAGIAEPSSIEGGPWTQGGDARTRGPARLDAPACDPLAACCRDAPVVALAPPFPPARPLPPGTVRACRGEPRCFHVCRRTVRRYALEGRQAVFAPALEGDAIVGARIFPRGPGTLFDALGIRGSDVVLRVNGRSMASGEAILDGLAQVWTAPLVDLELLRKGGSFASARGWRTADGRRSLRSLRPQRPG